MARPKRIEGEKMARERMGDAFWDMLAEVLYHEMTGKEVRTHWRCYPVWIMLGP